MVPKKNMGSLVPVMVPDIELNMNELDYNAMVQRSIVK